MLPSGPLGSGGGGSGGGGDATSIQGVTVLNGTGGAPAFADGQPLQVYDIGGGTLRIIADALPVAGGGTGGTTAATARTGIGAARAGVSATVSGSTAAEGTGNTGATIPTFTGTAPSAASAVLLSGTGMTAAGQVMTSTDNQTIGANELIGCFLATATANSLLYIVSNLAAAGAPVAITVYGTPVTDAGDYKVLRGPTPAGSVSSHTHPGPSHTHAYGTIAVTQV